MDSKHETEDQRSEATNPLVKTKDGLGMALERAKEEIAKLHHDAMGSARLTFVKALHIGEKLAEVIQLVGHGEWGKWLDINLEFDVRAARNYLRLQASRTEVLAKYETVSHLGVTDAYRTLVRFSPKQKTAETAPDADGADGGGEVRPVAHPDDAAVHYCHLTDEELLVSTLTPLEAEAVLALIRNLGVSHQAYQILRAQGEVSKLSPSLQAKLAPYLLSGNGERKEQI